MVVPSPASSLSEKEAEGAVFRVSLNGNNIHSIQFSFPCMTSFLSWVGMLISYIVYYYICHVLWVGDKLGSNKEEGRNYVHQSDTSRIAMRKKGGIMCTKAIQSQQERWIYEYDIFEGYVPWSGEQEKRVILSHPFCFGIFLWPMGIKWSGREFLRKCGARTVTSPHTPHARWFIPLHTSCY